MVVTCHVVTCLIAILRRWGKRWGIHNPLLIHESETRLNKMSSSVKRRKTNKQTKTEERWRGKMMERKRQGKRETEMDEKVYIYQLT